MSASTELLGQVKAVLDGRTPADQVGWLVSQREDGPPPWWDVELVATNRPGDLGCLVWVMRAGSPPKCKAFGGRDGWVEDAVGFFLEAVRHPAATAATMGPKERSDP